MNEKKMRRAELLHIRNSIPDKDRHRQSGVIFELLKYLPEYKNAASVFLYISVGSEVETARIIDDCRACGRRIAVPLCNTAEHTMKAMEISDLSMLDSGAYGISEPRRDLIQNGVISEMKMPELVIVPAISFDLRRQRMGYGGGYYDRYLSDYVGFSVGLAYSECITECLPTGEYDRCVDVVICPERMI